MRLKWLVVLLICFLVLAGCKGKEQASLQDSEQVEQVDDGEEDNMAVDTLPSPNDDVDNGDDDPETDDGGDGDEAENHWSQQYGFEVGGTYPIYGETLIYPSQDVVSPQKPVGKTKTGERYIFIEIDEYLVKVKTADVSGWVSLWYFTKEAGQVADVDPYEMVVLTNGMTSFYPDGATDFVMNLKSGQVVQVNKEYNGWVSIDAVFGQETPMMDMWVKGAKLLPFELEFADVGVLRLGGKVYNEQGRVTEEKSGFKVRLVGEKEDMYAFVSTDGLTGYMLKEDFEPLPFGKPTLAMIYAVNDEEDAHYVVEELAGETITLRYFNYGDGGESEEDVKTVPFDDMLAREDEEQRYVLELWLVYPLSGVKLKPTEEVMTLIEIDPNFRKELGKKLDQSLDVSHDLTITANMIRK